MIEEKPIWYEYATFDERGPVAIRDDAPDDAKLAFDKYVEKMNDYFSKRIMIPK